MKKFLAIVNGSYYFTFFAKISILGLGSPSYTPERCLHFLKSCFQWFPKAFSGYSISTSENSIAFFFFIFIFLILIKVIPLSEIGKIKGFEKWRVMHTSIMDKNSSFHVK